MAILQLKSTNPKLSYLIKKNPDSRMIIRAIRQGLAFGWFSCPDNQIYNIYFKDADNDISYKKHKEETFEYLNVSRYSTPIFPMNAISEFFSATVKNKHEFDTPGYEHQLVVPFVYIQFPKYVEFFNDHFDGYSFNIEQQAYKSFTVTITTEKGLYELLNVASLLFLFLALIGNEYIEMQNDLIQKFVNLIVALDAPYFIRYLFVRNMLSNRKLFFTFKEQLEHTSRYQIELVFGNTLVQRRNAIEKLLKFDKSIVDIGCGEGNYAFPFSEKISGDHYYAIDTDEAIINQLDEKIRKRGNENIFTYCSIDEFIEHYNEEKVDVILTEVIEHMPMEMAEQLIRQILDHIQFESFVITTPNEDFNQFYVLDEFRHLDHHWEIGEVEFQSWIKRIVNDDHFELEFLKIGDQVNGIPVTQGVLITERRS